MAKTGFFITLLGSLGGYLVLIVVNYMQGLRASMAWEYFSLYSADRHYDISARHGLRLALEDILDLLDKYGGKICIHRTGMRLLD